MRWSVRVTGLLLATLAALEGGTAATMTIDAHPLSAGTTPVDACDPDGFSYRFALDAAASVTTVTVTGIHAACAGGRLRVTLADGAGASVGKGSVLLPGSGFDPAVVAITPSPASGLVATLHSIVEGP